MPGQPPPDGPDDRTVLYALPEDQPDSLSEGHTSNQADLDLTPAEKMQQAEGDEESEDSAPAKSANKAEWVDYAVSQGADREEAEGMTKDDLTSTYGE